jgi:HPt (histidine-containing phosphotransfer) domain-containing protein
VAENTNGNDADEDVTKRECPLDVRKECPLDVGLGVMCMGSLQAYRELVQCFKETLPHSLRSIEEAYRTQDMDRLFHETHALKGTAAHAQAMELTIVVNTLQHCAGAYEQFSDVCDAYAQFVKEAQRVSRFLEKHSFQTTGDSGGDDKDQFRIS